MSDPTLDDLLVVEAARQRELSSRGVVVTVPDYEPGAFGRARELAVALEAQTAALHRPVHSLVCQECARRWPCRTAVAIGVEP